MQRHKCVFCWSKGNLTLMASCCSLLSLIFFAYFQIGGQTCHVISSYKSCYLSLLYLSGSLPLVHGLYNLYLLGTLMERFHVTSQSSIYALHSGALNFHPPSYLYKIILSLYSWCRCLPSLISQCWSQCTCKLYYLLTLWKLVKKYDTNWKYRKTDSSIF